MRPQDGLWYVLSMNDMRAGPLERVRPVARARQAESLERLLADERCAPYFEETPSLRFRKCFRKGGPLEWKRDPAEVGYGTITGVFVVSSLGVRIPWDLAQDILTPDQIEQIPLVVEQREREQPARKGVN